MVTCALLPPGALLLAGEEEEPQPAIANAPAATAAASRTILVRAVCM
jgi:hypothetical protein